MLKVQNDRINLDIYAILPLFPLHGRTLQLAAIIDGHIHTEGTSRIVHVEKSLSRSNNCKSPSDWLFLKWI